MNHGVQADGMAGGEGFEVLIRHQRDEDGEVTGVRRCAGRECA